MSGMQSKLITTNVTDDRPSVSRSWPQAYLAFLLSPKENLILKVAPLALLLGAPELIASNFLPIVGEISDLTALVLWAIVFLRTVSAVSRYTKR